MIPQTPASQLISQEYAALIVQAGVAGERKLERDLGPGDLWKARRNTRNHDALVASPGARRCHQSAHANGGRINVGLIPKMDVTAAGAVSSTALAGAGFAQDFPIVGTSSWEMSLEDVSMDDVSGWDESMPF